MKLLVTTYNFAAVYDLESGSLSKIHEGAGKYFGVSWDSDTVYMGLGRRAFLGEKYGDNEKILCFNRQLQFTGELFNTNIGLTNVHQLLVKDAILWMVNTGKNRIDTYHLHDRKIKYWYPHFFKRNKNYNHFNSIYIQDNRLYLLAHNDTNPSRVYIYRYPQLSLLQKITLGTQAHNLLVDGDEIYICDSAGSKNVISSRNSAFHIEEGYTRGIAASESHLFVGVSNKAERGRRQDGDCRIVIFNRKNKIPEKHITLKDAGNIYEIRILDAWDYAHGIQPFM